MKCCRGTLELCQCDHQDLGHLPDQGPSRQIALFARVASSRMSLGDSKLLPLKNDGGHCVLGDLQCCRNVLVPFSRSVPQHNPVSELYGQFLRSHGLFFCSDVRCQLWNLFNSSRVAQGSKSPGWRSGLRHSISVLEASLQTPVDRCVSFQIMSN